MDLPIPAAGPAASLGLRLAWLWILVVFLAAMAVRVPMMMDRPLAGYYQNEDASSHVLVTARAIASRDFQSHHFLPIFTIDPRWRWIDNLPSASVATTDGDFIYTSFPPLAFALTALIGKVIPAVFTPIGIRLLAVILGLLAATLIGKVAANVAKAVGSPHSTQIGLVAALAYFVSPEALHSFCISLWGHQFCEVWIACLLLCLQTQRDRTACLFLILATLTEWSAYPAGAGICLYAFTLRKRDPLRFKSLLRLSIFGAATGGLLTLLWFSSKLPLGDYLYALAYRGGSRAVNVDRFLKLALAYPLSLGGLALVLLLRSREIAGLIRRSSSAPEAVILPIMVVATSLLENLVLSGHAESYTFDRLKGVALAVLMLAWILSLPQRPLLLRPAPLLAVLLPAGMATYLVWRNPLRDWTAEDYRFSERLGTWIQEEAARHPEATIVYDGGVRADLVYYSSRNFTEGFGYKMIAASLPDGHPALAHRGRPVDLLRFSFRQQSGQLFVAPADALPGTRELAVPLMPGLDWAGEDLSGVTQLTPKLAKKFLTSWNKEGWSVQIR